MSAGHVLSNLPFLLFLAHLSPVLMHDGLLCITFGMSVHLLLDQTT